jgi:hypothetical protein
MIATAIVLLLLTILIATESGHDGDGTHQDPGAA